MIAVLLDTFKDTLLAVPFLLGAYLLLSFVEGRLAPTIQPVTLGWAGPLVGAMAGSIPQCGFAAASATLYNNHFLGAGTLIAVFLATSDEAIPILLANPQQLPMVAQLIGLKIVIALIWGYAFYLFWDLPHQKHQAITAMASPQHTLVSSRCNDENCACQNFSHIGYALWHTMRIVVFLLLTMLIINTLTFWIGDERLAHLLLNGTIWQPLIAAALGFIPGCGTSVLLTTLFLKGALSFGATLAGLSTGAGFGYLILFQAKRRRALPILAGTYLAAVISGIGIQMFIG